MQSTYTLTVLCFILTNTNNDMFLVQGLLLGHPLDCKKNKNKNRTYFSHFRLLCSAVFSTESYFICGGELPGVGATSLNIHDSISLLK